jgi:uncharacterized protein
VHGVDEIEMILTADPTEAAQRAAQAFAASAVDEAVPVEFWITFSLIGLFILVIFVIVFGFLLAALADPNTKWVRNGYEHDGSSPRRRERRQHASRWEASFSTSRSSDRSSDRGNSCGGGGGGGGSGSGFSGGGGSFGGGGSSGSW